ncbi:uncharacterized protein LOC131433793 [Malaya genurostris]|uniref:uncharacterized protein LOC131433793 n=1 Tax=Malaya genurostris TaxID=325434 RepID=UPI0026F3C2AA|nr:uncharacterized protein LOC131433793 [Malaya genurostris]
MMENNRKLDKEDEVDVFGFGKMSSSSSTLSTGRPVSIPALEEYYDMSNKRRGIALVFNHKDFSTMSTRNGTDKDRDNICNVLEDLEFEVRVFDNFARKELLQTLKAVSEENHSENDCLAVVVMSHGEEGFLYASDKKYNVEFLWKHFIGDACPSLIGKPKMFFIQACRGEQFDRGSVFTAKIASKDVVDSKKEQMMFSIPAMADLLVMYSTPEGYYSWRNPRDGSWFIQSLCKELKENGKLRDLLTLMTGVSRRTAYEFQSFVPHDERMDAKKQVPCIVSTLTKTLYFTKKSRNKLETFIECISSKDLVFRKRHSQSTLDILTVSSMEAPKFNTDDNVSEYSALSEPFSDLDESYILLDQRKRKTDHGDGEGDEMLLNQFTPEFRIAYDELIAARKENKCDNAEKYFVMDEGWKEPNTEEEFLLTDPGEFSPKFKNFIDDILKKCDLKYHLEEKRKKEVLRKKDRRIRRAPSEESINSTENDSLSGVWRMLDAVSVENGFPMSHNYYDIYDDRRFDWLSRDEVPWNQIETSKKKCEHWLKMTPTKPDSRQ